LTEGNVHGRLEVLLDVSLEFHRLLVDQLPILPTSLQNVVDLEEFEVGGLEREMDWEISKWRLGSVNACLT
jgi:hypothetical protein